MKRIFTWLIAISVCSIAQAQIPSIIPYQGSITDTSGVGFEGDFDFEFKILYNNSITLWSSGTLSVPVQNGNYSVSLGSGSQPAIARLIFDLDEMYLEISFNGGVNGKETLTPNVRILPVPCAMRAAYADSASNKANVDIGDSLVLRNKNGDVRMVLNPNTGEFKMVSDDTVWYNLNTNSRTIQYMQLPGGGFISRDHRTEFDGATYLVTNVQYGNGKGKAVHEMMTVLPKGDPNPLYIEGHKKYCPNGVELAYTKYKYQYVRDTVIYDRIMYEGYHIEERWYDCNGTLLRYVFTDPNSFTRSYKKPENTVVETVSDDNHIIIYTVGKDTFETKVNPKNLPRQQ